MIDMRPTEYVVLFGRPINPGVVRTVVLTSPTKMGAQIANAHPAGANSVADAAVTGESSGRPSYLARRRRRGM
jgi:hypothetical protein